MKKIVQISAYFLSILVLVFSGCSSYLHKIEKKENSLTIFQDSSVIQIEIIDESIIHVKKVLNLESVSNIPDYVTILEPVGVPWDITENKEQLIVSTEALKVFVNADGVIEYQTSEDRVLLTETNEYTFIKPNNPDGYCVSQSFRAGDEGIYGLGQFQSGIMNWKHVPARLRQTNLEIVIPFIVSTNDYGIYWHNYSETEFNATEHEIEFTTTIDEEKRIRECIFNPELSGIYSFMLESNTQNIITQDIDIQVVIDGDSIINYSTYWGPVCFSGQKYLEAGKEYKITLQNTNGIEPGRLLYNGPDYNKTVFSATAGNAIDYYFVHGSGPAEVISEYQRLSGKAPLFPKTAYGFWQCRERYHDQAELLENAREYRQREIPVDNIVQDWFYWPEGTKGPEWDRERYPDPQALNAELASLNLQLMVSVWPEVNNTPLLEKYDLETYKLEGTNFLDLTDPGVSERYYRMLSDSMFHLGVSYIWLDGSEPESKPAYDFQTAVAPFADVANCYSLLVTKSMYEGKRKEFPEKRVFNLTRSSYAGQQRYGATSWSGDIEASWEQFSEQIAAGLNFTMAGVPYWTHDIGGFFRDSKSFNPEYDSQYTNEEYRELLTRWFQFGTFSPVFRIHGYVSETEIWRYGAEFERIARKFIDLRYKLMPYIYSEAWKATTDGKLLMSPVVYQYPGDKNTWGIKDQFFFGESLLICPVMKYKARSRELYLPEGNWYNFWTGELIGGGDNINAAAPMDEPPIYVKAGTILPIGPKVQYATQKSDEALRIKVYPGKDAEYTLYFDDNESYEYEQGIYSELKFRYSESTKELNIETGSDKFIDFEQNPMDLMIEMAGADREESVRYSGAKILVKL